MATTTTNYGFDVPTSSDLVKNGATQIALLGQDLDTFLFRPFTKNVIINGGMDIWQRGTSSATSGAYTTADRWYMNAASTTFSQETTVVPTGSRYSLKALTSGTTTVQFRQAIETMNAIGLAGKTVTLSGEYQASSTTTILTKLFYSTSVDNSVTGSWTEITATSGGSVSAVNGSFTKSSSVFAVPSTAKSLMVLFDTGSVSTALSLYYANIQLEIGTQSSPFTRAGATIQGELAACQRYYLRFGGNAAYEPVGPMGTAYTTTQSAHNFTFEQMRVAPTSIEFSTLAISDVTGAPIACTNVVLSADKGTKTAQILTTTGGVLTVFRNYMFITNNSTSGFLALNAEL
jgi:hypothetical protein